MKRSKLHRAKSLNKATPSASPHLFDKLNACKLWHNEQYANTRLCPAANFVSHGRILGEKDHDETRMHKLIHDVESVLDALPLAAVLIDASDGRFPYINRRAMQLFELNYTDFADQLTKINLQNLDGKSFSLEDLPVSQSLGNGKTVHSQKMIIKRDGGTCAHVLVNSAPPV